ncbi:MAG: hypothetical protein ABH806_02650 [Candidatus Omnitrophota bacterium]
MRVKIILAVISGLILGSVIFFLPWLALVLFAVGGIMVSLYSFLPHESRKFLLALFVSALALRVIVALMLFIVSYGSDILRPSSVNVNPGETIIAGDASGYSAYGWLLSEYWKGDRSVFSKDEQVALGRYFFTAQTYLLAILYYLFGCMPLLGIILNSIAGALSAVIIFFIAHRCCGLSAARITAILTAFWPSIFLWSVNNSKEPISMLSMQAALLAGMILYRKISLRFLALFAAGVSVFFIYQPQLAVFFLFWLALIFIIKIFRYPEVKANLRGIILICVICILLLNLVMPLSGIIRVKSTNLLNATVSRNIGSFLTGGSVYKIFPDSLYTNEVFRTGSFTDKIAPFNWMLAVLKGLFYFLFAPFPWMGGSLLKSAGKIEMLLWYIMMPFFFFGILLNVKLRNRELGLLAVFLVFVTFVYSLAEANVGTTFRHRSIILPLYFLFVASALDHLGVHNYGTVQ